MSLEVVTPGPPATTTPASVKASLAHQDGQRWYETPSVPLAFVLQFLFS